MNSPLLRCRMTGHHVPGVGRVYRPMVRVHFGFSDGWSPTFRALVDSGASISIAQAGIARSLGIDLDQGQEIRLQGAGGSSVSGPLLTIPMKLGPHSGSEPLVLDDMRIVFTDHSIPAQILLGQHNLLERLSFIQRNQLPIPEFVLRLPS